MDPLDSKNGAAQAWVQFRLGFSAATALRALVSELPEVAPGYFVDLAERVSGAVSQGQVWSEQYGGEGDWDGFVPLQGPIGTPSVTFMPWTIAIGLEQQLFPEGASESDQLWLIRGAIVIMLNGVLEAFAYHHGFKRGSLAEFFRQRFPDFPVDVYLPLQDLGAVRNAFAHSAGVANEKYRDRVAHRAAIEGERVLLSDSHLDTFFRAAWRAGGLLHGKSGSVL